MKKLIFILIIILIFMIGCSKSDTACKTYPNCCGENSDTAAYWRAKAVNCDCSKL